RHGCNSNVPVLCSASIYGLIQRQAPGDMISGIEMQQRGAHDFSGASILSGRLAVTMMITMMITIVVATRPGVRS
ncbi:MAG: hypothetical protein ABR550_08540, partial [Wenzhouxiangellaceae bacterium]